MYVLHTDVYVSACVHMRILYTNRQIIDVHVSTHTIHTYTYNKFAQQSHLTSQTEEIGFMCLIRLF